MKTKFVLRNYKNSEKLSPLYLHVSGNSQRERINLDILVNPLNWDAKKQRLKPSNPRFIDINLILDNIEGKVTNIKTVYRLSEIVLTPSILKKEMIEDLPRVNFCAFFEHALKEEKPTLKIGTYKRYKSVLKKLKDYNDEIIFTEINDQWFEKYRKHLRSLNNATTTINSNIIGIKKYLRIAQKSGIKMPCNLEDIKSGSTQGNRISLNPTELKRIYKFYNSEFIIDSHKLIIGYFLFGCMTGLRFSDIMDLERPNKNAEYIEFKTNKTSKDQVISLNSKAREIVTKCPELFKTKLTNQYINRELKIIFKTLGIRKKISFHVARHTFATSFLRMGGRVEKLQMLLGHSDISQTMIYVHIVSAEANESIHLLDNLF
ncbi:tyrosine-type recombinase/integrase [Lutibacter sp.]|uniref:tyrosine-type recombinase/integrase n=1 Tax=Lutibacter sp. TaxID=1925666 RepID=UPI00356809E7